MQLRLFFWFWFCCCCLFFFSCATPRLRRLLRLILLLLLIPPSRHSQPPPPCRPDSSSSSSSFSSFSHSFFFFSLPVNPIVASPLPFFYFFCFPLFFSSLPFLFPSFTWLYSNAVLYVRIGLLIRSFWISTFPFEYCDNSVWGLGMELDSGWFIFVFFSSSCVCSCFFQRGFFVGSSLRTMDCWEGRIFAAGIVI